jgi:hypothetical protein
MLLCSMANCHHTTTMTWQHSWIRRCLSDATAERGGGHFLVSAISTPPPPTFFCRALWKMRFTFCQWLWPWTTWGMGYGTATAKTDQSFLWNVWQEVECRLDVCGATNGAHTDDVNGMKIKNFLSCSLQWCAFNFCVDITFLPITLCNRRHCL